MDTRDARQTDEPIGGEAPPPGAAGYDEWLLDEAICETFPASDAPSPSRPGSTLARRYETASARRRGRDKAP